MNTKTESAAAPARSASGGKKRVAQGDRPAEITPAAAHLSVVRSTLSILAQTIFVMVGVFFLVNVSLHFLGVQEGGIGEFYEITLTCVFSLVLLYKITLRPLTRLAAQHAAAAADARFEAIAHAAGDAIVIIDTDWKILFVNRATEKMFGYRSREWKEAPLEAVLTEETRQLLRAAHARYLETGVPELSTNGTLELEFLRRDGSRFPAELRVSELRDGTQRQFVGVLRDISARKHVEREIQERTTRLNALIANSPLAIVVLDKNQRMQMCNAAFEELFQYHSAEICGLEVDSLVAPKELLEEASRSTQLNLQGSVSHGISKRRRKDGSLVDVEIHGVPLLVGGQVEGAYGIYQDISERKKLRLYEQILPVCCMCGKIRDDQGAASGEGTWDRLDHYISRHSDAKLSHTFCPPCLEEYRRSEGLPAADHSVQGTG